jgi:DNA-binding transcriptional regulator YiaG
MLTRDAIRHFGSLTKLARALSISRQAVHQWGRNVPDSSAFKLQVITHGALIAVCERPSRRATAAVSR